MEEGNVQQASQSARGPRPVVVLAKRQDESLIFEVAETL